MKMKRAMTTMNRSNRVGARWWGASMALAWCLPLAAQSVRFTPGGPAGQVLPDGSGTGYVDTQTVTMLPTSVRELRVRLTLEGTSGGMWNGDIYATVQYQATPTAPVTAYAVLLNRPGRDDASVDAEAGYEDNGFDVSLGSTGPDIHTYRLVTTPAAGAGVTGNWSADGRDVDPLDVVNGTARTAGLGAFQTINPNGVWTLYVEDTTPGGVAKLTQWGLEWTPVPEPAAYASVAGALLLGVAWRLRRRSPSGPR